MCRKKSDAFTRRPKQHIPAVNRYINAITFVKIWTKAAAEEIENTESTYPHINGFGPVFGNDLTVQRDTRDASPKHM